MQVSDGMGHVGNEGQVGDNLGSEGKGLDGSGRSDMDNAKEKIEEFDWEGLEEQFYAKMEECRRVEEGLMGEFGELVEVWPSLRLSRVCAWCRVPGEGRRGVVLCT